MPTPTTNYESLTLKQLSKIQSDVANAMARKVAEAEKAAPSLEAEAVALINRLVAQKGLPPVRASVAITVPQNGNGAHKKAKARKPKIAIKYRDQAHPENTWTGRGRMPRWMAAAVKGGKTREDFKIA